MANWCESGGQLDGRDIVLILSHLLIWTSQTPLKSNFLLALRPSPGFAHGGAFSRHPPNKLDTTLRHLWTTSGLSPPCRPICAFG